MDISASRNDSRWQKRRVEKRISEQINDSKGTKTMKGLSWILIMMFSIFGTEVFAKEWNGIVPCVSTRADVEKILGKERNPEPDSLGSYKYKKSRVYVFFIEKDKAAPDKDVVKRIHVFTDRSETLTKYIKKIPNFHKDFEKTEIDDKVSHVYGLAYYRNQAEGFEIVVQKNDEDIEVVAGLYYFDPNNFCEKKESAPPFSRLKAG